MAGSLRFYGDGISFQVVFNQSFWLRVLPGGASLVQPRWMPERRILGGDRTCGVSFWPFPNSSCWWWLISSVFLTRTSCHNTTHANGYYGAWLTILEKLIFIKNSFGAYHYLSTTNASSHLMFYVWLPSKNGMLEMKLLKIPLVRMG